MLIPSNRTVQFRLQPSLSRRVNANSQPTLRGKLMDAKLIKKGEC